MIEDTAAYKEMMRMNYDDFCEILRSIEQYITPKEIFGGAKVDKAAERLTLAIRLMATGETIHVECGVQTYLTLYSIASVIEKQ